MTSVQKKVIVISTFVLIIVMSLATVNNKREKPDFGSSKEGTFVGNIKENYFKEPIDDVVTLFSSASMPGLSIIYEPESKKLIAGSPQMIAENIALFDGKKHQIAYTFKKEGGQQLYYDGLQVAQSKFEWKSDHLTGMVVREEAHLSQAIESYKFS